MELMESLKKGIGKPNHVHLFHLLKRGCIMKAIGVDPGISNSGLAVINWDRQRYALKHSETVKTDASLPIPARLVLICEKVSGAITEFKPDLLAIEGIYFNKNISSCISTAIVIGACVQIANDAKIPAFIITPQEAKKALTGRGNAVKKSVMIAANRLFKLSGNASNHAADAIAIGMAGILQSRA